MSNVGPSRTVLLGTENPVAGVTSGQSQAIHRSDDGILSFYIRGIGTISTGTLIIEEADYSQTEQDYTGTWSQIASITLSGVTGNAQTAYHITDSSYGYVRVRLSAAVTGGGSVYVVLRSRGAN